MKSTPISGDLLVKLGLGAAVLGAVVYGIYKVKNLKSAIIGDPRTNAYEDKGPIGVFAETVDTVSGGVFSRVGEYLGGKAADWLQPDPMQQRPPAVIPEDPYDHIFTRRERQPDAQIIYDELGNAIGTF